MVNRVPKRGYNTSEKLDSAIQRIHRAHFYLKNSTTFIHEGGLTKKCRSRNQLYADKSMTGRWSPHNSLRLKLTPISNIPDGVMSKHAFQIQNPIKSFVVFADSASSKAEWMRLIDAAGHYAHGVSTWGERPG